MKPCKKEDKTIILHRYYNSLAIPLTTYHHHMLGMVMQIGLENHIMTYHY